MTYLSPEQSVEKREARAVAAAREFENAAALAETNGLRLLQRSRIHYQLEPQDRSWLLNIYPSNRRLYHDIHKQGPYLHVSAQWTLLDVVAAAKEKQRGR